MSILKDLLRLFKKNEIVYVSRKQESEDIVTFKFKPKGELNWEVGQHGIITVDNGKKKQGKAFSIASVPQEGEVLIATRVSREPSDYKKALMNLKPGDTIIMKGPIGNFMLDESKRPVLFVAGGIGITPFRALLQEAIRLRDNSPITAELLYIDSKEDFIYREELDAMVENHDFIKIRYIKERDELQKAVQEYAEKYENEAYYFISGTVPMVKSIKELLKKLKVKGKNIKNDPFYGY